MAIYYSPEKMGFFDTSFFDYKNLPKDCIEITKEEHVYFLNELNMNGKRLEVSQGKLVLQNSPEVITWQRVRNIRNNLLNKSDYTQVPDFPGDREAWASYRQELRDIPQTFDKPEQVVWPWPPK